jgi:hypothetical protein
MHFGKHARLFLPASQLLVNACHITIHYLAPNLLLGNAGAPSIASKLLIYVGGFLCFSVVGIYGSKVEKEQADDAANYPFGNGRYLRQAPPILLSFAAEGLTLYLVQ